MARALVVLDDVAQGAPRLIEVLAARGEEALGGLRVAQDRTEGLVQFMGQRGGELTQSGDAGDVREFIPQALCLQFRIPARRDVAVACANAQIRPVLPQHGLARVFDPADPTRSLAVLTFPTAGSATNSLLEYPVIPSHDGEQ